MELDITKTNYLQIPLIEEYYALQEPVGIYMSSPMKDRRDLYEIIIDRFQPFSSIKDVKKNIEILNNTVFLHQKKLKKVSNSFPKKKIASLNTKGIELLGLSIPF